MGKLSDDLDRLCVHQYARSNFNEPIGGKAGLVVRQSSSDFMSRHYESVRELGHGNFSRVSLVREMISGRERVCKTVRIGDMEPKVLELARREIPVLAALDHAQVVKLYEYTIDVAENQIILILEYIPGGHCGHLRKQAGGMLNERLVARIIHQILLALSYCHSKNIMHRDIKPENVMLRRMDASRRPLCSVVDFGLASLERRSNDFVGTPAYIAPEIVLGEVDHTSKVDMWSVACTAIELLTGEPPFGRSEDFGGDMQPVLQRVVDYVSFEEIEAKYHQNPGWAQLSSEAKRFICNLLQVSPAARLSARQALCHPWIETHRPIFGGISSGLCRSMEAFAASSRFFRCCLLALIVRRGVADFADVGIVFGDADVDDDGRVTGEDLVEIIQNSSALCGWSAPNITAAAVLDAIDLAGHGSIEYSEFCAACLHHKFSDFHELSRLVFMALDDDRDGCIFLPDVVALFADFRLTIQAQPMHMTFPAWNSYFKAMASVGTAGRFAKQMPKTAPLLPRCFFNRVICGEYEEEGGSAQLFDCVKELVAVPAARPAPQGLARGPRFGGC